MLCYAIVRLIEKTQEILSHALAKGRNFTSYLKLKKLQPYGVIRSKTVLISIHGFNDNSQIMKSVSYLMVRLGIGISMLGHGLVRIPKLNAFSEGMINNFQSAPLPDFLLIPFSFALPFIEFLLGLLLIIGWQTKRAAIVGGF